MKQIHTKIKSHRVNHLFNISFTIFLCVITSCQKPVSSTQSNFNYPHPGAKMYNSDLIKRIKKMEKLRGDKYVPRTKFLTEEGKAKFTNRLFLESSPYLLQHAHNPVDWYPWGNEAFAMAKKLNRPVFLSVGYSTCHWCHVMEEESFEDLEIATYLNQNYISIKVDREERPDVDSIYMKAIHAMGQNGGWPMNLMLTDQKKPFFGGTYFPARDGDRGSSHGFLSIIKSLKNIYDTQKDKIRETSEGLSQAVQNNITTLRGITIPSVSTIKGAVHYYKEWFDSKHGGIGNSTKFPSSVPIRFLLRYYQRTKDQDILKIIDSSLTHMAYGGIYDQVGGGFHRYSTIPNWLIPHFEKMLYDNALIVPAYLEAYQVSKNPEYLRIVNEVLSYVKRDMTSLTGDSKGAFYSATDADSRNSLGKSDEGYFYTWTQGELKKILSTKQYKIVEKFYGITKQGNFEDRNILNITNNQKITAKELNMSEKEFNTSLQSAKQIMYDYRKLHHAPPLRDEKIIVEWNALMISAYAYAGLILNNQEYVESAKVAANFILQKMSKDGRLFRSYKDNIVSNEAYLSDYSFFIASLLDLFEATSDSVWLKKAVKFDNVLEKHFEDKTNGGFFMTSDSNEKLLAREKPHYDGAEPAGNSIQALNLLRLAEFTTDDSYNKRAVKLFKSFSSILTSSPNALPHMLMALDFYYHNAKEIIIVNPKSKKDSNSKTSILKIFRETFQPNRIFTLIQEGSESKNSKELQKLVPLINQKKSIDGKQTAYVCQKGSCHLPTNDSLKFKQQLDSLGKAW